MGIMPRPITGPLPMGPRTMLPPIMLAPIGPIGPIGPIMGPLGIPMGPIIGPIIGPICAMLGSIPMPGFAAPFVFEASLHKRTCECRRNAHPEAPCASSMILQQVQV
jgi:hypothetical protein